MKTQHPKIKIIKKKKVGRKKDATTDTMDIQRIVRVWATMGGFPGSSAGKESTCESTQVQFLGQQYALEKG